MKRFKLMGLQMVMLIGVLVSGCAKNQTPGTSQVEIQIGNLTAMTRILNFLMPEARAAVNSARVCFKRVKFKTEEELHFLDNLSFDDSDDSSHFDDSLSSHSSKTMEIEREEEIEFRLGEIDLSTQGNKVGTVTLPEDTYTRIEFEFERDGRGCLGNRSVDLINTTGSYSTTEKIKIRLDGRFVASEASQVLSLNVGNILEALDQVTSSSQIKSRLENLSVRGSFE